MTMMSLISAVKTQKHREVQQLLTKQPTLANETDAHGNTPLHYAVAQQDLESIKLLLTVSDLQPERKNNYGESALAWYQEYARLSLWIAENIFHNLHTYCSLSILEKPSFCANYLYPLVKKIPYITMRFSEGNTILHLAICDGNLSVVKDIFNHFSGRDCKRLLNNKNFLGETPLILAQKLRSLDRPGAQEIASLVLQKSQSFSKGVEQPLTIETLPQIILDLNKITELGKYFSKEITQKDWPSIIPLLPALVSLCYFTCCLAITQCDELLRNFDRKYLNEPLIFEHWDSFTYSQQLHRQAKELFHQFLRRTDKEIILYIKKQTLHIASYLADMLLQEKVNQVIELAETVPEKEAIVGKKYNAASYGDDKIIYKLIGKYYFPDVIMTLLHESSHIALKTMDHICYTEEFELEGNFFLHNVEQMASEFRFKNLYQKELLELQFRLENRGENKESWAQWICKHNADTVSFLITLLAANYSSCVLFGPDLFMSPEPMVFIVKRLNTFLSNEHIKYFTTTQNNTNIHCLCPAKLLIKPSIMEKDYGPYKRCVPLSRNLILTQEETEKEEDELRADMLEWLSQNVASFISNDEYSSSLANLFNKIEIIACEMPNILQSS